MMSLFSRLVKGHPRLFENPIGQLREMIGCIALKDLESLAVSSSDSNSGIAPEPPGRAFVEAWKLTLDNLEEAERYYLRRISAGPAEKEAAVPDMSRAKALISSADLSKAMGKFE